MWHRIKQYLQGSVTPSAWQPGQKARLLTLATLPDALQKRFMAMGILPGSYVTCLQKLPLGSGFLFEASGYAFSLAYLEATLLDVETL